MTIKEQAIDNLRDIKSILDDLKIVFWLDGGTCLGAYRDKDFCKDDEDDTDLCCWDNHLYQMDSIIDRAIEKGFMVKHRWELEVCLVRGEARIDLFFNRKNKGEAYTHLYNGDVIMKYVVIPVEFYERLEPIKFMGIDMLIPSPIEKYLTLKYGDWRTPVHRSEYLCYDDNQNKLIRDNYDI